MIVLPKPVPDWQNHDCTDEMIDSIAEISAGLTIVLRKSLLYRRNHYLVAEISTGLTNSLLYWRNHDSIDEIIMYWRNQYNIDEIIILLTKWLYRIDETIITLSERQIHYRVNRIIIILMYAWINMFKPTMNSENKSMEN